jgi:hypothetical protein
MRFRELVETPTDKTERRGRRQWGFAAAASEGAGPTAAALLDGRECSDRHRLDRAFLAALPVIPNCPIEDGD